MQGFIRGAAAVSQVASCARQVCKPPNFRASLTRQLQEPCSAKTVCSTLSDRGTFAVNKQPACNDVKFEINTLPLPPKSTADDRPSGANYVSNPCLNIQLDKPGQTMMFHGLLQISSAESC